VPSRFINIILQIASCRRKIIRQRDWGISQIHPPELVPRAYITIADNINLHVMGQHSTRSVTACTSLSPSPMITGKV